MLTEAVHIWWYIFFSWRTDELKDEAVRRVEWKVTNDVLDEDTFQPSKSDYYYFVLLSFLSYSFLLTFFENKWRWCFCMNTHWLAQWVILLPSLNFRIHFCKLAFLHQQHQQQHKITGNKSGNKLSITGFILIHGLVELGSPWELVDCFTQFICTCCMPWQS